MNACLGTDRFEQGKYGVKILFLHGWNSEVGGVKPTYLKDHGHEVINPALPHEDFAEAVRIAQAEFDKHKPGVVVGSSRGGAVAMNINSGHATLVLLCAAWKNWGNGEDCKTRYRHPAQPGRRCDSVLRL